MAVRVHLEASWTDPNALATVPPIVFVEVCGAYDHAHRSVLVAEQHDLAVVCGEDVVHLDLNRSYIRPDLLDRK